MTTLYGQNEVIDLLKQMVRIVRLSLGFKA
jgi:hypothetical protein